jgi:hypothetical protein
MGRYYTLSYYDAPLVVFRTTGEDDGFFYPFRRADEHARVRTGR